MSAPTASAKGPPGPYRLPLHRSVPLPALFIAACAEATGLTLLHYDADFDLIADLTGQATQWVVARGSVA